MVDHRAGGISPFVAPRDHTGALWRGDKRLVRRPSREERLLPLRSDELPRAAPFLRAFAFREIVGPKPMGAATAGCAGEYRLRLAEPEIRAAGRTQRQSTRRARHGRVARVHLLRALLHPRSVAPTFLDVVYPRRAWAVEVWNSQLSLVRGHGNSRHDSHERDLHHSSRL